MSVHREMKCAISLEVESASLSARFNSPGRATHPMPGGVSPRFNSPRRGAKPRRGDTVISTADIDSTCPAPQGLSEFI